MAPGFTRSLMRTLARCLPPAVFAWVAGVAWTCRSRWLAWRVPVLRWGVSRLPGDYAHGGPPRGVATGQVGDARTVPGPEPFRETTATILGASPVAHHAAPVFPSRLELAALQGAVLDGRTGAVCARHGLLVAALSPYCRRTPAPPPWDHPVFSDWQRKRVEALAGDWVVLQTPQAGVYYHWMLEVLPRVHVLRGAGMLDGAARYLVPPLEAFHRETLAAAGIPEGRLRVCDPGTRYRCERLVCTSDLCPEGTVERLAPWLKTLFGVASAPGRSGVLYVTRKQAGLREVVDEERLVAVVESFGGRAVSLEGLPVAEQARLFAGSRCIVSPHGSSLANLVFCHPGTAIIEMAAPAYVRLLYPRRGTRLGLRYWLLVGEGPGEPADRPGLYAPIRIRPDTVRRTLDQALEG